MLKILYVWTCDICGNTISRDQPGMQAGLQIIGYREIPAPGWNWINGQLVCPRHTVTLYEPTDPAAP